MIKRNRLRNARPKALFGADGAIMGAATLAAAGIQAAATYASAKQQSTAIEQNAREQANMLKLQNDTNNKYQQQALNLSKENNELIKRIQENAAFNSQIDAASMNSRAMREAAKIQVKCGGSMRKRLRNGADLIDGVETPNQGSYVPIGYTPDGIMTILVGPSHNNGGVDIDINGKKGVEAEGGELMEVKYGLGGNIKDLRFYSKHNLPGTNFNPAREILEGNMTPNETFDTQENIKRVKGITDDGSTRKAKWGQEWWNGLNDIEKGNIANSQWNLGANILGAGINTFGNWLGSRISRRGYENARDALIAGYNQMKGIDLNTVDINNYKPGYAFAALQAPVVDTGAQTTSAERQLQSALKDINIGTQSSAARLNRGLRARATYHDLISQINSEADKIKQNINQENANRTTEISKYNAGLLAQGYQQYLQDRLGLLKYNNEIENDKLAGIAQAKADAFTNIAGVRANTAQANAASWAGALTSGIGGIGSALATNAKMSHELEMGMYGWDDNNLYNYYMRNPNAKGFEEFMEKYKDTTIEERANWYNNLHKRKYGIGYNKYIQSLSPRRGYLPTSYGPTYIS